LIQYERPFGRGNVGAGSLPIRAPAEFAANAVIYASEYDEADADRPAFWAKQAHELLSWSKD
jgi:hypothetical protein